MRLRTLLFIAAALLPPMPALAQQAPGVTLAGASSAPVSHTAAWTLRDVLQRAEQANPELLGRRDRVAAAQGARTDAGALFYNNPELTLERTRRDVDALGERRREWAAGLAQTIELGGKRGARLRATDADLSATRREMEALRRTQRADVEQRFYRVLASQVRVELARAAADLFAKTASFVERRRAAGEDTRLDANVALVEAERAENQLAGANEQLIEARAALAVPLQLAPDELPVVQGGLDPAPLPYSEESLLATASGQPAQDALTAREQAARAKLDLERARRIPDVTLGVSVGREGPSPAREKLTTLTLSVPLPAFNHNAAGIGQAVADLTEAQVARRVGARDMAARVHAQWLKLSSLRDRIARTQSRVLPTLLRDEELGQKSLSAGQIGLLEQIVVTRQTIDARRDLLDAQLDYHEARLDLEAAAGWSASQ